MTIQKPKILHDPFSPVPKAEWPILEDLHLHTNASDGLLSPEELVNKAAEKSLDIIAVTDHDSVAALDRAAAVAREKTVSLVPGVELTAELSNGSEVHIIGLFICKDDDQLQEKMVWLNEERKDAAKRTVETLRNMGLDISYERVRELAGGTIGRPHIARALLEKGYVESFPDAFNKYLGEGRPARVKKVRLKAVDAINLIYDAHGVSIVAHPRTVEDIEGSLPEMVDAGLSGIEVYADKYQKDYRDYYSSLAKNYGLIQSGGSDYHALKHKQEIPIGTCGPKPGTALEFYMKAKEIHGDRAGVFLTDFVRRV